ncbi:MAG: hypothetical protein NC254_02025 [bacterium]|nr:hypothetical protein [bacterium]
MYFGSRLCRKIRWYYTKIFQKNQKLWMYSSYRHYKRHKKKADVWVRCQDYSRGMYITKRVHPTAGIGDQLASWNSGLYYAGFFGLEYAATRLYPREWEQFLGINEIGITEEELIHEQYYKSVWIPLFDEKDMDSLERTRKIIASYAGEKVIFLLELDQIYSAQCGVAEELSRRFEHAERRREDKLIYKITEVNIACHIRRGDIMEATKKGDSSFSRRYLANNYYVKALRIAVESAKELGAEHHIYVFSQGEEKDFRELKEFENVTFCLDMSAQQSFLHMVRADILVTSKSSFSYKPALINKGIKICPANFWHSYPQESTWILLNDEGDQI